jgi:hypothetical protein
MVEAGGERHRFRVSGCWGLIFPTVLEEFERGRQPGPDGGRWQGASPESQVG